MSSPEAGWYPDPEDPGSGQARYWDGERWTEQRREAPTPMDPGQEIAITVLGALAVASGAVFRALETREDENLEEAETAGYIVGGIIGPVLIVLAIRFAYVRLFRKDARVWSPWIVVVAGAFAWLSALGAAGDS